MKQDEIVAYVERAVREAAAWQAAHRVLAAVSGGQDSVAMLLALAEVRASLGLHVEVGHVNHGLRGVESDGDEAFVRELADHLGLRARVVRLGMSTQASVRQSGVEQAARARRFSALRGMASRAGLAAIALAHTATDRAETVLMNILRGSGLEGLGALRAVDGDLVRPLLAVTRDDTAAYCAAKGVAPRVDSTNLDQRLLRNRIRLSLMPLLEQDYRAGIPRALVRLAEIAEGELAWTEPLVEAAYERSAGMEREGVVLDAGQLRAMPTALRRRVLRRAAAEVRGDLQDIGLDHLRALDTLLSEGRTGERAILPGLWAERSSDSLLLRSAAPERVSYCVALPLPGSVTVTEAGIELASRLVPAGSCDPERRGPRRAQLDAAQLAGGLVVRPPQPGDRIAPLGMLGTRKLQDLLVDKKIPRVERERIPVIATIEGEIVWVVGHRISERAKVTDHTRLVAEIEARPLA